METITFNLTAKARRVTRNGRALWIAPATIYPPGGGVMAGSQGPLYYPPSEQAHRIGDWNDVPLTLRHPRDQAGNPTSGKDSGIQAKVGLGFTANDRMVVGVRQVDAEFDEASIIRIWPDLLPKLKAGEPIELSTGLFTDNEPVENGGTCPNTGRRYTHIARNYRPDHLAVLPDQVGACSIRDGCGINVNTDNAFCATGEGGGQDNSCESGAGGGGIDSIMSELKGIEAGREKGSKGERKANEQITARGNAHIAALREKQTAAKNKAEKKSLQEDIDRIASFVRVRNAEADAVELFELLQPHLGVNVYNQVRSEVTGYFKRINAGHGKGPVHEAAQSGFQDLKVTDAHRELAKVPGDPPAWAQDVAVWQKAKTAAEAAKRSTDLAWTASVYESLGGNILELAKFPEDDGFDLNVRNDGKASPDLCPKCNGNVSDGVCKDCGYKTIQGGRTAITNEEADMTRDQMVQQLTTNCDCWKGKAKVLGNAELFSDDDLENLINNAGKVAVANQLAKGIKLPGQATLVFNSSGKPVVRNADGEECAPDDAECLAMMEEKKAAAPAPVAANKAVSMKEWEASMPDEAKAVWNAAKEVHEDAKLQIVKRLVANVSDPDARNAKGNKLMKRTLEELKDLADLIPTANSIPAQQHQERTYNFAGAGGAPAYNGYDPDDIEVLDLPTMNWDTGSKSKEEEMELV